MDEERLPGGVVSPVYRVGDTVRRTTGPWTPAVHELLEHLAAHGFDAAPRPLGLDDEGREILTYLPGETVGEQLPYPAYVWSDDTLERCGRLLRRYHDTVRSFRPTGRTWRYGRDLTQSQVICHNDWAPYTMVWRDGRLCGVIDWDIAGPSLPASDLAFAAWQFVPMLAPERAAVRGARDVDVPARLRLLLDAYGLGERSGFVARVIARARSSTAGIRRLADDDEPGFVALVASGYLDELASDIAHMRTHADTWQATLAAPGGVETQR